VTVIVTIIIKIKNNANQFYFLTYGNRQEWGTLIYISKSNYRSLHWEKIFKNVGLCQILHTHFQKTFLRIGNL